jgi:hypothetical protein
MCSPRLLPIAPRFNPLCFAHSPPLLAYIAGPKGEALHYSIEISILGSLHRFKFFAMSQSNWLFAKNKLKVELVRDPILINMKQNRQGVLRKGYYYLAISTHVCRIIN